MSQIRLATLAKSVLLSSLALSAIWRVRGATTDVWITGVVTECWEGRPKPVANLRVYVLAMDESVRIRDDLQKLESLPLHGKTDEVQAFFRSFDRLAADLKSLGQPDGLLRTDKNGRFTSKHLEAKSKYLVLAIDWDKGDMDELAYYRYRYIELGTIGAHDVRVFMGPGNEANCRK